MPKPKGDRLDLLRACRANLSPIWALSLADGLAEACIRAIGDVAAPMSATDDEGIVHELWPVVDPEAIAEITGLVATTPVVIADGHHRYETATFYRAERRAANGDQPGDYDLVMALIVELSEEELFVRPIHRLVSGMPEGFDFAGALAGLVEVQPGPAETPALVAAMSEVGALGLVSTKGNYLLVPRPSSTRPPRRTSTRAASMRRSRGCRHTRSPTSTAPIWRRAPSSAAGHRQRSSCGRPRCSRSPRPRRAAGACRRRPPSSTRSRAPAWSSAPSPAELPTRRRPDTCRSGEAPPRSEPRVELR